MDDKQYQHLSNRLHTLTPAMVEDMVAMWQTDPAMITRYGSTLRSMAEQGVISFRDVVLGALQFGVPGIVSHELNWLDRLLQARHIPTDKISTFLQIFRQRLNTDLTDEERAPLLKLLDAVQAQLNKN